MKKGPIILSLFGVALVLALVFAPVSPEKQTPPNKATQEAGSSSGQHSHDDADAKVEEALRKLESGELPPMQAVLTIREVAENHPENLKAQFTLGVMSMQTGQYEKAVERFGKVIAIDKSNLEAYRFLGRAHLNLQDTASARENYSKAIVLADKETRASIEQELVELKLTH